MSGQSVKDAFALKLFSAAFMAVPAAAFLFFVTVVLNDSRPDLTVFIPAALFSAVFFFAGLRIFLKVRRAEKIILTKTFRNYQEMSNCHTGEAVRCRYCNNNNIIARTHGVLKSCREHVCQTCGETLYYTQRHDFV